MTILFLLVVVGHLALGRTTKAPTAATKVLPSAQGLHRGPLQLGLPSGLVVSDPRLMASASGGRVPRGLQLCDPSALTTIMKKAIAGIVCFVLARWCYMSWHRRSKELALCATAGASEPGSACMLELGLVQGSDARLADLHNRETEKVEACICYQKGWTSKMRGRHDELVIEAGRPDPRARQPIPLPAVSVTTFNIHAPIHKRIGSGDRESSEEGLFLPRNARILELLRADPPTVICLQEFWHCSDKIHELYQAALRPSGYSTFITPRTNCRGDGLLTLVASDRLDVLHHTAVPYQECGDRVAHLLHLRAKGCEQRNGELLLVNTHLMFPHDHYSRLIRLRQCTKLLAYLHQYTTSRKLTDLPIVICGDWNGEPDGPVARLMRSQGFLSVYDEFGRSDPRSRWVSHLNHHKEAVGVDYIWLLNPITQKGTLTANWCQLVCGCILAQMAAVGIRTQSEAFAWFDVHNRGGFTPAEFADGVRRLHLTGDDGIGLIEVEVEEVGKYLDTSGDGVISPEELLEVLDMDSGLQILHYCEEDPVEFLLLYAATHAALELPRPSEPHNLDVLSTVLPESFARGIWPDGFVDKFSDHAPLSATFSLPL